jgi:hypothetical protein
MTGSGHDALQVLPSAIDGFKGLAFQNPVLNSQHFFCDSRKTLLTLAFQQFKDEYLYKVFHFEVSILAPRLDLGSRSQQILTFAQARSIWDFQPLGAKARVMPVDFSNTQDVKLVR